MKPLPYGVLSNLFGIASAVSFFAVFLFCYISQARSLTVSVAWAVGIGGILYAISAYFDRCHTRIHLLPPTRLLPSRKGVVNFFFVVFLIASFFFFVGVVVYGGTRLPSGDDWATAWIRWVFCLAVLVCGWQTRNFICWVSQRFCAGRVYDDWLDSLGKPLTSSQLRHTLDKEISSFDLALVALLSVSTLFGAIEWISPLADWDVSGRRARKTRLIIRWIVRWCIDHPNTLNLFATTLLLASVAMIARRFCRLAKR